MNIFLKSESLTTPHGFFTKNGGCSTGIYNSLNCGVGSDDDTDHVTKNRQIALREISNASELIGLYQIHSSIVHEINEPVHRLEGDGFVTHKSGIALSILTADCAPVLFHDPTHNVIGAAHAGWQGAFSGIIENTVAAMCSIGAMRENIHAVIGPCIAQNSYEVGSEFYDRIDQPKFFKDSPQKNHYLFDLPAFVADRLIASHITKTEVMGRDTYQEKDQFFSYRRTTHLGEKDYGRQISIICLP